MTTPTPTTVISHRVRDTLARTWLFSKLYNREPYVSKSEIESDGRSQKRAVREAIEAGWIAEHDPEKESIVATDKAANEIVAVKPDLVELAGIATQSNYNLRELYGVSIGNVELPVLRWIVEHRDEYTFTTSREPVVDLSAYHPVRYGESLFVRDDAFLRARDERIFRLRVEEAVSSNFSWGLARAGHVEPVDEDVFLISDGGLHFGGGGHYFGKDPSKWEAQAREIVASLRERIASDTRKVNVILRTNAAIAAAGGWDKFVAEYRARIEAALLKQDEKKAAEAVEETKEPTP